MILFVFVAGHVYGAQYLGKLIGKLSELHHGVSGEVYAVDGRTLHIKDFTYDGQGPGNVVFRNFVVTMKKKKMTIIFSYG